MSDQAASLEKAGNARDSSFLHERTDKMLKLYVSYLSVLEPFCREEEDDTDKEPILLEVLLDCFKKMRAAIDDLDMDQMADVISQMKQYRFEDEQKDLFVRLECAVEKIDVDDCEQIMQEWEKKL